MPETSAQQLVVLSLAGEEYAPAVTSDRPVIVLDADGLFARPAAEDRAAAA